MLANRITLDFFQNVSNYYHVYKINKSKAAELPHYHDFFQVCYVSKGAILHRGDSNEVELVKGDAFIIPPSFSHSILSETPNSEFYSLSFMEQIFYPGFSGSGAYKFLAALQVDALDKEHLDIRLKVTLEDSLKSNIKNLLDCLLNEFPLKIPQDLSMAGSLISAILLVLARAYFAEPKTQDQLKNINIYFESIMACKEYIDKNYMRNITLLELSKEFALSRSILCLLFPKIVGVPPIQYLTEKRIEQALSLSKVESLSFQEISDMVGYEDYSTFFRNFCKIVGISPTQYRSTK